MHIIKLNAIDSTNTYLKEMSAKQTVDNFTVVVAENQTNGRGHIQRREERRAEGKLKKVIDSILKTSSSMLHWHFREGAIIISLSSQILCDW